MVRRRALQFGDEAAYNKALELLLELGNRGPIEFQPLGTMIFYYHNGLLDDYYRGVEEIEKAILKGDIIEVYPNDPRGVSCLIAALLNGETLHIVCGFRDERLLIVTVYRPKLPTWKDYKTRVKELKGRV